VPLPRQQIGIYFGSVAVLELFSLIVLLGQFWPRLNGSASIGVKLMAKVSW
jgi:hypothetical protein